MTQDCWTPTRATGFLMAPDPIEDLGRVDQPLNAEATGQLMDIARTLPARIARRSIRDDLRAMPVFDMAPIAEVADQRITERLCQIYATLANAFVWSGQARSPTHLPEAVAVPAAQLAQLVERPPIVSYVSTCLANFERLDPDGPYELENLRCIQKMVDIADESWFHLVHVEIEARAGAALFALLEASHLAQQEDTAGVEAELAKVPPVFDGMIQTFRRITERCNTDVYYHSLRPYLFGFEGVVYEGVAAFGGQPMRFMGGSGAQSSVIPAIKALIGLRHSKGGLSEDLIAMQAYMPKPHRTLLSEIDTHAIRALVGRAGDANLRDIYNLCLERIVDFRSLHLKMAHAFIAQKVKDPRGTGGTDFMIWLTQLRDETAQQVITAQGTALDH